MELWILEMKIIFYFIMMIRVEVLLENEDVWLNVEAIAKLFGV